MAQLAVSGLVHFDALPCNHANSQQDPVDRPLSLWLDVDYTHTEAHNAHGVLPVRPNLAQHRLSDPPGSCAQLTTLQRLCFVARQQPPGSRGACPISLSAVDAPARSGAGQPPI